jgi:hypothetical protein
MKTKLLLLSLFLMCPLWSFGQNCSAVTMLPTGNTNSCQVPANQFALPGQIYPDTSTTTFQDACFNAAGNVYFNQSSTVGV